MKMEQFYSIALVSGIAFYANVQRFSVQSIFHLVRQTLWAHGGVRF